jgi:hypothetical protein
MLVRDICILLNISALILNRFLIVNWSNGLLVHTGNNVKK